MQFTKLRLVGFKSFVEPMEFVIENGLTGVVGPNGCGKSNLVEALRWVMGENSYKNMRASGMDDVIFSGSATRPPRNSAEVSLYLDNSDYSAPPAFNDANELQVSRRIEREAGSVYRINGKDVRAKDVQLLFADQSTGARSPSMVGQGRVGELIQAKPQARRALLEEAAGISGLHSRRHEAELRLRAAEGNLERLEDIIRDLANRIESLKRQARQANRFKILSADIRKTEAGLFYLRWSLAKTQEAEAETMLSAATGAVAEKAEMQMQAARLQALGKNGLPALREEALKAQAAHQRLSLAAKALEEEQSRNSVRQSELVRRLEQLVRDMAREEELLKENADILLRLAEEEEELHNERNLDARREEEFTGQLETLAEQHAAGEATLSELTAQQAALRAEHTQIQHQVEEQAARRQKLESDIVAAYETITRLSLEISQVADTGEMDIQVSVLEQALLAGEQEITAAEEAVARARLQETEMRTRVNKARDTLLAYEAEARTLEKMLSAFTDNSHTGVVENIVVQKGYEMALGSVLGGDLDAALDSSAPVFWQQISTIEDDPALPEGVVALSEVVQAPAVLHRRLAQIGIVESQHAAALQEQLKVGQRLVSPDGGVWRWDGLTARADAATTAAVRLAQKNRLAELETLVAQGDAALQRAQERLHNAENTVHSAAEAERAARDTVRATRDELDETRRNLMQLERLAGERISRRDALKENYERLYADHEETLARLQETEEKLAALPPVDMLENEIAVLRSRLAEEQAETVRTRAAYETWRHKMDARTARFAMINRERLNWQTRIANAENQLAELHRRHAETAAETDLMAKLPDNLEERKKALLDEIVKAEKSMREVADRLAKAETAQTGLDRAATEAIQALAFAREGRARAEERLNAAIDRRKDIEARIAENLACPPHETMRLAGFSAGGKCPAIETLEQNLERLRMERERLGAVNLRAEEEAEELTAHHEAMTVERDDIIEAVRKLRLAIQNLNREGRERLLQAFEKVNHEFRRLFTHLFGGGTAELQLVESDDPLDAGLEILARPPGKKPQTMTLLSGGEQALTAMALIFAVFLTNPAPICVLDEVDAPLDDHNVERYCNLLDEMAASTDTRFIIITHNPITMARMNRLFGVTMGEQGISQLVSVDLQTAEEMRDTG